MLKKITSEEVLEDIDRRLQKNNKETIKHLESSLENLSHQILEDNPNSMKARIIEKINQLKEQNSILQEQIEILESIHQHLGIKKKFCTTCNSEIIDFLPFGENPRERALCPNCFSLERHRATYLFLKEKTRVFKDNLNFLHIAPEKILQDLLSVHENLDYLTADLNDEWARIMEKMDIQDIKYPNNTFDFIFCSHVLEHVSDDKKALKELCRVLKTDGKALILVPMRRSLEKTIEDPKYNTPELRLRYYGQSDHLRFYGSDFIDRLKNAGFTILTDELEFTKDMDEETINRYGIQRYIEFFYCTKI